MRYVDFSLIKHVISCPVLLQYIINVTKDILILIRFWSYSDYVHYTSKVWDQSFFINANFVSIQYDLRLLNSSVHVNFHYFQDKFWFVFQERDLKKAERRLKEESVDRAHSEKEQQALQDETSDLQQEIKRLRRTVHTLQRHTSVSNIDLI